VDGGSSPQYPGVKDDLKEALDLGTDGKGFSPLSQLFQLCAYLVLKLMRNQGPGETPGPSSRNPVSNALRLG